MPVPCVSHWVAINLSPKTPPKSARAAPSRASGQSIPGKPEKEEAKKDGRGEGRKDKHGEENQLAVIRREGEKTPVLVCIVT